MVIIVGTEPNEWMQWIVFWYPYNQGPARPLDYLSGYLSLPIMVEIDRIRICTRKKQHTSFIQPIE